MVAARPLPTTTESPPQPAYRPRVARSGRATPTPLTRMSQAREVELARRMRAGEKAAREELFRAHTGLARRIAGQYVTERAPYEDLCQEACLALWAHLPRFDPDRGFRVTTILPWYITRDVARAADAMNALIRRPVYIVTLERKLDRIIAQYEQRRDAEGGSDGDASGVSMDDLIVELDAVTTAAQDRMRRARQKWRTVSLDMPVGRRETRTPETLADRIEDTSGAHDPEALAERADLFRRMRALLPDVLTTRQLTVLALRYGAGLSGTAAALALQGQEGTEKPISRQRIAQIEAKAIRALRQNAARAGAGGLLSELYALC